MGLVPVLLTACGSVHVEADKPTNYVPWLPLPAAHQYVNPAQSPPAPPPIPQGTRMCTAAQVEGVGLASGAAAGNVDMPLLFRNRSNADCYVEGFVDVTAVDASGRVLARSSGVNGRGTFFADAPVRPVLMAAGTPALPAAFTRRDGSSGQVFMNFSWYDCAEPVAAALVIGLPGSGGTFEMRYGRGAATSPACGGDHSSFAAMFRGPLTAAGSLWPYIEATVELSAPRQAKRGSVLTYFATLTNTSSTPYSLLPCADYEQLLVKQVLAAWQLNCAQVVTLGPGRSATFEMRVTIPSSATTGKSQIVWCLNDGRLSGGACGVADITIT